jgi:hypothetical protein
MKLYVCFGTFKFSPRPSGHPCGNAYHALKDAGHDPEVVLTYGFGPLPDMLNPTRGEVRRLTGSNWVPVLVLDDGTVIQDSKRIIDWAESNPAMKQTATDAPTG